MVILTTTPSPEFKSYYDRFSFPLSPFQQQAIEHLVRGNHVLVTAPTGSGKTLPAEFAIHHFCSQGKRVIYTSPIKALSNQKYAEFTKKFPELTIGLLTGDIKTNPIADVLIMTTEILMNHLFYTSNTENTTSPVGLSMDIANEVGCVIFDEVHYINDEHRGEVWEKTITLLPKNVQMLMLSATIAQPEEFARWCESQGSLPVALCSTTTRVVPLTHYTFMTINEGALKKLKDKTLEDQWRQQLNRVVLLQDAKGAFSEPAYHRVAHWMDMAQKRQYYTKRPFVLNTLLSVLMRDTMLPAIVFGFSRAKIEQCARDVTTVVLADDSKVPYTIRKECETLLRRFPNAAEYLTLPEYEDIVSLMEKGVAYHHSGMIPVLRELVETFIAAGKIQVLFATESFAIGLDCPIKTAVFTTVTKFDGTTERYLYPHEYTQMAGRAGRRGIDTVGHVILLPNLMEWPSITCVQDMMRTTHPALKSKLQIKDEMLLSIATANQGHLHANMVWSFLEKSLMYREHNRQWKQQELEWKSASAEWEIQDIQLKKTERTPWSICQQLANPPSQHLTAKKRKEWERQQDAWSNQYKWLKQDVERWQNHMRAQQKMLVLQNAWTESTTYLRQEIEERLALLNEKGFLEVVHAIPLQYTLTLKGKMAAALHECPPLITVDKLMGLSPTLTPEQWVGWLSCFMDIKVKDAAAAPMVEKDPVLQAWLTEWDGAIIQWDMISDAIAWYHAEDEQQCKWVLQELAAKQVSAGDFSKGILKVVAILQELKHMIQMYGTQNHTPWLHQWCHIESKLLKFIVTNQSLYITR